MAPATTTMGRPPELLCLWRKMSCAMLVSMSDANREPRDRDEDPGLSSTTQSSVVLAAGSSRSDVARQALAELCEKYWQPLYFFVRQRGYTVDEAPERYTYIDRADKTRDRFTSRYCEGA